MGVRPSDLLKLFFRVSRCSLCMLCDGNKSFPNSWIAYVPHLNSSPSSPPYKADKVYVWNLDEKRYLVAMFAYA